MAFNTAPLCVFIIIIIISTILTGYEAIPHMATNDDEYDGYWTTLALLPRTSLKIPTHKSAENFRKEGLRSSSSQRRYTSSLGT